MFQKLWAGFRCGLILQMSVGPVCLLVVRSAITYGFWPASAVALAITIVDGLYIVLSCLGLAALMKKEKVQKVVRLVGCIVLVIFGLNMIASGFGHSLMPRLNLSVGSSSLFVQGLILTLSSPLGIIFWAGIFSTQVAENNFNRTEMTAFGVGCVLATFVCMNAVAFVCSLVGGFLADWIISALNVLVGCGLIFFGIKRLRQTPKDAEEN